MANGGNCYSWNIKQRPLNPTNNETPNYMTIVMTWKRQKKEEVMSWYKQELATTNKGHTNDNRSKCRDSKSGLPGLLKG